MIRRLATTVAIACALIAFPVVAASAEVPPGPRLTFLRAGQGTVELVNADPAGESQQVIVGGGKRMRFLPYVFSPPAWSADGGHVAFTVATRSNSGIHLDIYESAADGSEIVKLPRTSEGFYPRLSPDAHTLAFARKREKDARRSDQGNIESVSTWLLDLETGAVRQVTPWRNGLFEFPSSFSPDHSTLAISRDLHIHGGHTVHSAIALRLDGSGTTVLAAHASEPVYSPDGSRIALISTGATKTIRSRHGSTTMTSTELAIANADGSGLVKLTHTRALELEPSWDPSGQRLAYTQLHRGVGESEIFGIGDSIMEINANGSCRTRVLSYSRTILYGAIWQPGPGREAGPISC